MNKNQEHNSKCSVKGCQNPAEYEVFLFDVYPTIGDVFLEVDRTCQTICGDHLIENEAIAEGTREPRGIVEYPYTNRRRAHGFTTYRPLKPCPESSMPTETCPQVL